MDSFNINIINSRASAKKDYERSKTENPESEERGRKKQKH